MKLSVFEEFANSIVMAVLDEKGDYIYVSDPWLKARGVKRIDVIGHNVQEYVTDTKAIECLRLGKTIRGELVNFNGFPVFTTYVPRFDSKQNVIGVFLFSIFDGATNSDEIVRHLSSMSEEISFYKDELSRERGAKYTLEHIGGSSEAIKRLKNKVRQAARSNSAVLIEGEIGSGKELIAHAIHELSNRRTENFVKVNCAGIPNDAMEAEFFGYAPGGFSGISANGTSGKFELADKGTIFLDEVNRLTLTVQPAFLTLLQDNEYYPIGSTKTKHVDVRFIAATDVDIEGEVKAARFRSDLFYRLSVIRIMVPPLRERKEDIPELTASLIEGLNNKMGMSIRGIDPKVLEMFADYNWPGNVRELQNVIESAMNITTSPILLERDFGTFRLRLNSPSYSLSQGDSALDLKKARRSFETNLIKEALRLAGGNKAKAAGFLGISRTELYNKLSEYGI